jgi:hypothetical protein
VVPVGLRLDAERFDRDELALDTEQLLHHALGLLVAQVRSFWRPARGPASGPLRRATI